MSRLVTIQELEEIFLGLYPQLIEQELEDMLNELFFMWIGQFFEEVRTEDGEVLYKEIINR